MSIIIRTVQEADADTVTALSIQLGYYPSIEETSSYIERILRSADDIVYVALADGCIVGWIHVFVTTRLESGTFAEIGGLVIDSKHRGMGIGKMLIMRSVEWCIDSSVHKLKVRCNVKRSDTHRFYAQLGFIEVKQQKVFELEI
jgi:GNAT superfamily N-acetyltransferase